MLIQFFKLNLNTDQCVKVKHLSDDQFLVPSLYTVMRVTSGSTHSYDSA